MWHNVSLGSTNYEFIRRGTGVQKLLLALPIWTHKTMPGLKPSYLQLYTKLIVDNEQAYNTEH